MRTHDRPEKRFTRTGFVEVERAPVIRSGERPPISPILRQLVHRRDRWTCQACGVHPFPADPQRRSGVLHLDHIVPWSAGGIDRSDNLRTLCKLCNEERSNWVSILDVPVLPIVRICAVCLTMPSWKPEPNFEVYCASRHHESWALPGWHIM